MKKVVIITNIPSPYRVDFFYYLQNNIKEYEFHIIYSSVRNTSRQWHADEDRIINSTYLKSKNIKFKRRYDEYDVYIPYGVNKALDELKPDVVVAMEYNPTVITALSWCKKHKVKYISWTDGTKYSERNINFIQKLTRKYVFKNADAFIASSKASRENQIANGAPKEACFISTLSVDIDKYKRVKKDYSNRQLICVGGLILRKGVDLLIDALALTDKDISLVIVGDGAEKSLLMEKTREYGIEDRVEFTGFLEGDQLYRRYENASAFVLPTREDCFGLVTLEAMCASLPVISSKYADGAYDLLEENVTGVIVDPYDTKKFAKTLEDMLRDEKKLREMGMAGYKRSDEFSFENTSKGYIDAINYVLRR